MCRSEGPVRRGMARVYYSPCGFHPPTVDRVGTLPFLGALFVCGLLLTFKSIIFALWTFALFGLWSVKGVDVGNVLLLLHSHTISCVPSHYKQTTNNKGEQR